jgi:DNA-directed RNA polymerase specialized sigma24 family protein
VVSRLDRDGEELGLVTRMARADEKDASNELDNLGRALLARLTFAPDDVDAARRFDTAFYELVWRYLRARHDVLGARVGRYLGRPGAIAPRLLESEVDEVAHDATATALRRVRQNAAKFDTTKGSCTGWVIGSAEFAYVEVAKAIVTARRSEALKFVDPNDLVNVEDPGQSTEEHVMRHIGDAEALADAAEHVSQLEFAALRLRYTAGYSRAEAAEVIFGDQSMAKAVDRLVERGARKLAAAWVDKRTQRQTGGSIKFSDSADD